MECKVRSVKCGVESMECEVWSVKCGSKAWSGEFGGV